MRNNVTRNLIVEDGFWRTLEWETFENKRCGESFFLYTALVSTFLPAVLAVAFIFGRGVFRLYLEANTYNQPSTIFVFSQQNEDQR